MTIDLRGVNTHNKGAHLMMMAIVDRLGRDYRLSVSPNGSSYDVRSTLGLRQTLILNQAPRMTATMGGLVPAGVRSSFGLTSDASITGVLDAAGFAYSDSFSHARSKREALLARRWARRRVPVILLPQAFGPFTNPEQRHWSKQLLSSADLVFARDKVSLRHVRALDPAINVELSPDFTVGLKPLGIPRQVTEDYAALVPNAKMISHTKMAQEEYEDVLVRAGGRVQSEGLKPVVVIHEFGDSEIGRRVADRLNAEVFISPNPLVLKRVLGDATVAVASRFHAIVSGLAQGTPTLAFGWSHKYVELLRDFGVPQWLHDPNMNVDESLDLLFKDAVGYETLEGRSSELRAQNERMWSTVGDTLGPGPLQA